MTTLSRAFQSAVQIIGTGDAYVTLSGTTEIFSSAINLTAHMGAHAEIDVNFDSTPTDNVEYRVYGSLDGTNWAPMALIFGVIDKDTDPNGPPIVIEKVAYARIGVKQTGSTDSHDVRAYVRTWNYTSA